MQGLFEYRKGELPSLSDENPKPYRGSTTLMMAYWSTQASAQVFEESTNSDTQSTHQLCFTAIFTYANCIKGGINHTSLYRATSFTLTCE